MSPTHPHRGILHNMILPTASTSRNKFTPERMKRVSSDLLGRHSSHGGIPTKSQNSPRFLTNNKNWFCCVFLARLSRHKTVDDANYCTMITLLPVHPPPTLQYQQSPSTQLRIPSLLYCPWGHWGTVKALQEGGSPFFWFFPSYCVNREKCGSHGHDIGCNNQLVVAQVAARMLTWTEGCRRGQVWPWTGSIKDSRRILTGYECMSIIKQRGPVGRTSSKNCSKVCAWCANHACITLFT